ncbi:MAG TPA: Ku protein [Verrucomicrobiae bacterium]|jgi:DNA end-binding protein Ku|nr:Ku protein [Verrucomicrobiae bacterium]
MRAIWKGSISFGLVNVPISLYPATSQKELSFRMLRKSDLSPINYKRFAEADGKEVPWEQIVKGYEYEKGKFVVLSEEDFERADIKATQTIDVVEFVHLNEIDPIFFDRPYYLEPQKQGAKAYALLREALKKTEMVGIAKVVLKTRQHLAAIKPEQSALVLEIMHFAEELVSPKSLQIPGDADLGSRELQMASELVSRLSGPWKPEKYTDDYRQALMDLIQKKIESGGKIPAQTKGVKRSATKVIDLVSVLQQSLEQTGKRAGAGKPARHPRTRHALKKAA